MSSSSCQLSHAYSRCARSSRRTVVLKRPAPRAHGLPPQALVDDEIHNTSILLHKSVGELPIPPELRRHTVEEVHAVDVCQESD